MKPKHGNKSHMKQEKSYLEPKKTIYFKPLKNNQITNMLALKKKKRREENLDSDDSSNEPRIRAKPNHSHKIDKMKEKVATSPKKIKCKPNTQVIMSHKMQVNSKNVVAEPGRKRHLVSDKKPLMNGKNINYKKSLSKESTEALPMLTNSEYAQRRIEANMKKRNQFVPKPKQTVHDDVWFEGVDPTLIADSKEDQPVTRKTLVKHNSFAGPTKAVAMDCEFVGVGYDGKENCLARVSIVNQFGQVLLDTFVLPREKVVDYRTQFSGVRASDLIPGKAVEFDEVHHKVADIIKDRTLIGHAIQNDLKVLLLSHPRRDIRDTSRYSPFRALFNGRTPSLRVLTERVLGVAVQTNEHDSVEDARAAMRLYTSVKRVWETLRTNRKSSAQLMKQLVTPVVDDSEKSLESKQRKFMTSRIKYRIKKKFNKNR